MSKLSRYCKELTATDQTKIMLARDATQNIANPINLNKKSAKIQKPKDKKKK